MIARVLAAVLLSAAAPAPLAAPAPAPAPTLHEITVGSATATMCANVVVHANAAILSTLRGDGAIRNVLTRLRTTDFETPGSARQAAIAEMTKTSNDLSGGVDRGKFETQRLREYAVHPAGADRSAEIGAFVTPLDAALELQHKAADGLAAFLTAIHTRDVRDGPGQPISMHALDPDDPDTFHSGGRPPTSLATPAGFASDRAGPSVALSAKAQASNLEALTAEIVSHEACAAVSSEPAVGGC